MRPDLARRAIYERFADNWSETPFAFENEVFSPPEGAWLEVGVQHTSFEPLTLAGQGRAGKAQHRGYVWLKVFTPAGQGVAESDRLTQLVRRLFVNANFDGLRIERVQTREQGRQSSNDYLTSVRAYFTYFEDLLAAVLSGESAVIGLDAELGQLITDVQAIAGVSPAIGLDVGVGFLVGSGTALTGNSPQLSLAVSVGALTSGAVTISGLSPAMGLAVGNGTLLSGAGLLLGGSASVELAAGLGTLVSGAAMLVGDSPAVGLTAGAGQLIASGVTLSGSSPSTVMTAGLGNLLSGGSNITGSSPEMSLEVSTGALSAGAATLTGTSPATQLDAAAGSLTAGSVTITGASPSLGLAANDGVLTAPQPSQDLLMDTYSQIAHGWSLRKLRADYTGPCVRVRRNNGTTFPEADIFFDSNGFIDEAALAAHCGSDLGEVVTFYEQGANGEHVTQTVATNQPLIWDGSQIPSHNGVKGVLFRASRADSMASPVTGTVSLRTLGNFYVMWGGVFQATTALNGGQNTRVARITDNRDTLEFSPDTLKGKWNNGGNRQIAVQEEAPTGCYLYANNGSTSEDEWFFDKTSSAGTRGGNGNRNEEVQFGSWDGGSDVDLLLSEFVFVRDVSANWGDRTALQTALDSYWYP